MNREKLQFIECNLVMLPKTDRGVDWGARRALICQHGEKVLWWKHASTVYLDRGSGHVYSPGQLYALDYSKRQALGKCIHEGGNLSQMLMQSHGEEINKFFGFEVAMDLRLRVTLLVLNPSEELPAGFSTLSVRQRKLRERDTLFRVKFEGWHEDGPPKLCSASAFKDGKGWQLDRKTEGFPGRWVEGEHAHTTPVAAIKEKMREVEKEIARREKSLSKIKEQLAQLHGLAGKARGPE